MDSYGVDVDFGGSVAYLSNIESSNPFDSLNKFQEELCIFGYSLLLSNLVDVVDMKVRGWDSWNSVKPFLVLINVVGQ